MTEKWIVHDFDKAPERAPRPRGRRPLSLQRTRPERRSFNGALLVSVLLHALLLSQLVGGEGQGLPGLVFPWQERRAVVPDIHLVLVPPPAPPAAPAEPSVAVDVQRASIRSAPVEAPTQSQAPPALPAPRSKDRAVAQVAVPKPMQPIKATRHTVAEAVPVSASPPRAEVPDRAPLPPSPAPAVLTAEPSDVPAPVVPVAPEMQVSANAVEPSASSPDPASLAAREVALEAQRQEAARAEAARLEVERQETARQAAAQLEAQRQDAQRQEAARQAAARAEAARLEAERQEAARQAAAKLDAQRQEAARQAAARAEAVRLEAERQEAARQAAAQLAAQQQEAARQAAVRAETARLEAERQEAARQAAAQLEAQRQEAARAHAAQQEAAAKREAVLRAIGRQLDEENARRDAAANAARPSNTLPLSLSTARRARLLGHTDPNADLVAYAQAWALKIQLNTLPDKVREVARRPHTPATVTVALRRDGSVESVTFVVSSGVAEIDDAIRRIVETQRPYPVFPPALAREFDVVEIRRTWYFDSAVRLH